MWNYVFEESDISDESAVEQGLDVQAYREFVEFAQENPEMVRTELRAVGEYEGTAYHTATHFGPFTMGGEPAGEPRDYTLEIGVPAEFEESVGFVDPVDRMESVEVALGALTTCITNTISQAALLEGLEVEHITTSVSLPLDLGYCSVSSPGRSVRPWSAGDRGRNPGREPERHRQGPADCHDRPVADVLAGDVGSPDGAGGHGHEPWVTGVSRRQ